MKWYLKGELEVRDDWDELTFLQFLKLGPFSHDVRLTLVDEVRRVG